MRSERNVPILLWPFYAIWRLLTFVLERLGMVQRVERKIADEEPAHVSYRVFHRKAGKESF